MCATLQGSRQFAQGVRPSEKNDGAVRCAGFIFEANKILKRHESDANIWLLKSLFPTAAVSEKMMLRSSTVTSRINILLLWNQTLTFIFVWQPNVLQKRPVKSRMKMVSARWQ